MELREVVESEFGLPVRAVTAGGRGALGEIWRLHIDGGADLAAKLLAKEPPESLVALEISHTDAMRAHGVRVPASIANRYGRYVTPTFGGWLRVSEWIAGERPDPADPMTPLLLGEALGRMHAHTAPVEGELDSSWFRYGPDMQTFANLIDAAEIGDRRWAGRLHALLPTLQSLSGITKTPATLVLCHRDLHPENVLRTADGEFAILDWDNLGPADPSQELGSALLHWFAGHTAQIEPFLVAYRSAGGEGDLIAIDDFAMHLATSLNFLALQLKTIADPQTGPEAARRAIAEIEESLLLLPTTEVLAQCLACASAAA